MKAVKLSEVKKGDYFTLKPLDEPKESQVYVRDEYCREAKSYICYKFEDVNRDRLIKGSKEVYIDFYF